MKSETRFSINKAQTAAYSGIALFCLNFPARINAQRYRDVGREPWDGGSASDSETEIWIVGTLVALFFFACVYKAIAEGSFLEALKIVGTFCIAAAFMWGIYMLAQLTI